MALAAIIGIAAAFGAAEGIRASQHKARREEHRTRKNNLIVHCPKSSQYSASLEGRSIVLSGDKLYVDTGTAYDIPFGHPFAGYYLPYPDTKYSGLVSSITDEAPIMNWIYVHRDTYEVKFGTRQSSEGNLTGPWDCSRQDRRLTLGGWEGFVVVLEGSFWALYFDRDDNNLKGRLPEGTPVIEIELIRKEMRIRKPLPPPPPPPPTESHVDPQKKNADTQTMRRQAQQQRAEEKEEKECNMDASRKTEGKARKKSGEMNVGGSRKERKLPRKAFVRNEEDEPSLGREAS